MHFEWEKTFWKSKLQDFFLVLVLKIQAADFLDIF